MAGKRILALLLCCILTLSMAVSAHATDGEENQSPETNDFETSAEPTDTQTAEAEITIPDPSEAVDGDEAADTEDGSPTPSDESADNGPAAAESASGNWAEEALAYCVSMGILDAGDLRGEANATRAEFADMVTRLFQVSTYTPLSDDTYTGPYAEALAKAVSMGILSGDETGDLRPNDTLTREEACVILCRAFGLYGGTAEDLTAFSDADQVGYWAISSVGYLVRSGYLTGSGGMLRPKDPITRQELAQLLKNLNAVRITSLSALPDSGTVILTEPVQRLENITVDGDLMVTASGSSLTIQNVHVSGRLVVSSPQNVSVTVTGNDCAIGTLALCCPYGVTLERTANVQLDNVGILSGFATVVGGFSNLYTTVTTNIYSFSNGTIEVAGSKPVSISANSAFDALCLSGYQTQVTLDGACETLTITGEDVTVNGSGQVHTLVREATGSQVSITSQLVTDTCDAGIQDIVITPAYTVDDHGDGTASVTVTFTFSNVDLTGTNGAASRTCTIDWSQDYVSLGETEDFALYEGAAVSRTVDVTLDELGNTMVLAVIVKASGQARAGYAYIPIAEYTALHTVTTIEVEATVLYDTTLYSDYSLSNPIGTVAKGTVGIYDNYYGTTAGRLCLPDGRTGWVRWSALSISDKDYVQYTDYSTYTKEGFVNAMGYSSTTEMLVWVSLKTQKVNVFYGSQGDWTLYKTFSVCTGKTIAGVFSYKYKDEIWDFGSYYVKPALVFNGGHAFHSRTYVKSTGALLDPTIGTPASHGCVRMYDSDVQWLDQYMKVGTTVVVY